METRRDQAEESVNALLDEAFREARVFKGGGTPVVGNDLALMIQEAATDAVQRLYREFRMADNVNWGEVYKAARNGAPDALKRLGYEGDVSAHPVCKAVLNYVSTEKSGLKFVPFRETAYGREAMPLMVLYTPCLWRGSCAPETKAGVPSTISRWIVALRQGQL